uniref:ribosomal protein L16 n=1 Tax=Cephaleuros karstenii TaxID=1985640 RepID=UPI001EE01603|nr:ribosomal protein L16 [Cephaleuros karstenii]UIB39119.1 ribosomal protein L16 [Cephaleuros karstenii]
MFVKLKLFLDDLYLLFRRTGIFTIYIFYFVELGFFKKFVFFQINRYILFNIESRMGTGKGSVEYWVFPVLPEKIIFEITGLSEARAREAFRIVSSKLPIKTRFVSIND